MLDPEGRALSGELRRLFGRDPDLPLGDGEFDRHARQVFAYAFHHVPAYAGYCRARGAEPGTVERWTEIPAVPTAAFKELRLLADGATADVVFRTSGTTRGRERRGAHHVADLALYQASLRPTFARFLLPDEARLPFLSLMPAAADLPDSSLAYMISDVTAAFGAPGSETFADTDGLRFDDLESAIARAVDEARPVMLLGTSAAFIHWLDRLTEDGRRYRLPDGSRLMDTGGFKGRGRDVDAGSLRKLYGDRLGIPEHRCVNEYGMTELLSQRYDDTLAGAAAGPRPDGGPEADRARGDQGGAGSGEDRRWKAGPPWLRSVAVDPETLAPLPDGQPGLLRHVDLANLGSVPAVQTEDFGRVKERRVLVEGRATGAAPRGCSIAMDLLLGADR